MQIPFNHNLTRIPMESAAQYQCSSSNGAYRSSLLYWILICCIVLYGGSAFAQSEMGDGEGVNSQVLWITPGPSQFAAAPSSDILHHKGVSFGTLAQYYRKPIGLNVNGKEEWAVKRVTGLDFSWAFGIIDYFQIGMILPVVLEQYGKGASPLLPPDSPDESHMLSGSAVGDLRFHAKTRIMGGFAENPETRGFGLAVDVALSVPTGDELNFAGENGIVFAPSAIFDFHRTFISVALNTGVRLRSGDLPQLASVSVGNQYTLGAGATFHLLQEKLLLSVENNLLAEISDFSRMGIEFRGAVGTRLGESKSVSIWLSGGAGFASKDNPLLSIPEMRFLLGLTYTPSTDEAIGL